MCPPLCTKRRWWRSPEYKWLRSSNRCPRLILDELSNAFGVVHHTGIPQFPIFIYSSRGKMMKNHGIWRRLYFQSNPFEFTDLPYLQQVSFTVIIALIDQGSAGGHQRGCEASYRSLWEDSGGQKQSKAAQHKQSLHVPYKAWYILDIPTLEL